MTADSKCLSACENPSCPLMPLLRNLSYRLETLSEEVEAMHQTLKNMGANAKKTQKATGKRPQVNRQVFALQVEYPEKVWTADDFAKKIGCSGAAVRRTKAWKDYKNLLKHEKQKHLPPKGYKDNRGNLDAFDSDKWDDI